MCKLLINMILLNVLGNLITFYFVLCHVEKPPPDCMPVYWVEMKPPLDSTSVYGQISVCMHTTDCIPLKNATNYGNFRSTGQISRAICSPLNLPRVRPVDSFHNPNDTRQGVNNEAFLRRLEWWHLLQAIADKCGEPTKWRITRWFYWRWGNLAMNHGNIVLVVNSVHVSPDLLNFVSHYMCLRWFTLFLSWITCMFLLIYLILWVFKCLCVDLHNSFREPHACFS